MISLSKSIADLYRKHELLPSNTIDCMEYSLKAFENEISKFLMYTILFSVFDLFINFLLVYGVFVSIRLFAGGLHCKTYWGCAVVSLFMLSICVFIGFVNFENLSVLYIIAIVSSVCPILLSPLTPSFRLIKTDSHKILLKTIAVILTFMWVLFAWLALNDQVLIISVLFTVSLVNYQLVFVKLFKQGGEK